ncbi:hypothetical protein BS78_01G030400 [Paspalum vaginatum]|nr:hypothetical protein BS78_01G030400 [Paspalum vaginatum]
MGDEQTGSSSAASVVAGGDEASAHEKLQLLETLLVKIHSAVEVSVTHAAAVDDAWVVQCRDTLREAATEGDEALAFFRRRTAMDARATTSHSRELDDDASSTAAAGALFFTRNALSGTPQCVRDATNNLFSGADDTKRLDMAVERLEQLSPDITELIRLLQLEVLPKIEKTWPATRKRPPLSYMLPPLHEEPRPHNRPTLLWPGLGRRCPPAPPEPEGRLGRIKEAIRNEIRRETMYLYGGDVAQRRPMEPWVADTPEYKDWKAWVVLLERFEPFVICGRISGAVKMTVHRDMAGLGALARWAAVLREAQERGQAVLLDTRHHLRKYSNFNDDEPGAQCPHGRDEVHRLERSLGILGDHVESFGGMVELCPWDFAIR